MNKCQVCGHKHGSVKCGVKLADKSTCNCTSHSSKFDKGAKFNHGSGKHARMLEAMKGGGN